MRAIVDTNVLVRMFTHDHPVETPLAEEFLRSHDIVVTSQTLCELVWVLMRIYRFSRSEIERALVYLGETESVYLDDKAFAHGLSFLRAGGDFADGIIEYEGRRQGGEVFVTFDRKAASIIRHMQRQCTLLGSG